MTTVAFIGLGAMGSRMARRLLDTGNQLVVWNRTPEKAEPLVALGASLAPSPAEAARRGDVVITMAADPCALRAVSEGRDGLLAGLAAPRTVIEMSTVGPSSVTRLAEQIPAGAALLDAPVLGSLAEAASGTLRIFLGGTDAVVARWLPLLTTLGTPLHVGSTGAGAAAKLVANSTLFGALGVLGEALALSEGLGLSRDAAFEIIAATPSAAQAERRRAALEAGVFPPRFTLSLARKDADLVVGSAAVLGLDVRLARAAQTWLADAEAAGWGDHDYSAVLAQILSSDERRSTDEPPTIASRPSP